MRRALWIVGPPGAGKTTRARELLGAGDFHLIGRPKWTSTKLGRVVAAGHYSGQTFDGADTVGYSQVDACLIYWREVLREQAELTIFDGDRFSFERAVRFVRPYVDRVEVEYVTADPMTLASRRAERGWNPSPAWLKGRETKARRFAAMFSQHVCPIHSTMWATCKFKGGPV